MTPGGKFWATFAAVGVGVELLGFVTQKQDWMVSQHARRWLHTDHPLGRAFVTAGIGAGACWLAHHLIATPTDT